MIGSRAAAAPAADDRLVRLLGWPATILHGDPCVADRWRFVRRHLARGPVRTLDAGCGSGAFTLYAARCGNVAVGVSYDGRNNRAAERRAALLGLETTFVDGDLRRLDDLAAGWEPFDQVLCLETIEHVADDAALVAALARRLRPGGRLLLTTPSSQRRPLYREEVSGVEDGGHVRFGYTRAELRALVEAAGLTVVVEEGASGVVSHALTSLLRRLAAVAGHRCAWTLTLPLRLLQAVDRPLTRLCRGTWLGLAVVAVKERDGR